MGLHELTGPVRERAAFEDRLRRLRIARRALDAEAPERLPSERAPGRARVRETARRIERLELASAALGEVDRFALLRQLRRGPAPRWFLYDPLRPADLLRWTGGETIAFEMAADGEVAVRLLTDVPPLWRAPLSFTAEPLLLPGALRKTVRSLEARSIRSFILFEPAVVRGPSGRDHRLADRTLEAAVVVEEESRWFLIDRGSARTG